MNFGLDDIINKTILGTPTKELEKQTQFLNKQLDKSLNISKTE